MLPDNPTTTFPGETFRVLKNNDTAKYGEYRTRRLALEAWARLEAELGVAPALNYRESMARAIEDQTVFTTTSSVKKSVVIDEKHSDLELVSPVALSPQHTQTTSEGKPANVFFQRTVLAAEIVDQMHELPTFGHVKFVKALELCELDADLGNLETHYYRQAAGPLDRKLLFSVDGQLKKLKWFHAQQTQGRVQYIPMRDRGKHKPYFDRYWGSKKNAIQHVIDVLTPLNTKQAEIIATLYTAWNDLILSGETVTDARIVDEATTQWHKAKESITQQHWNWGLAHLRENKLIPRGTGKPTLRKFG